MKRYTREITLVLLVAVFTTLFMPAAPAQAFSLSDLTGTSSQNSGGSSSLLNILLALLLGKVLGTSNNSSTDMSPALGSGTGSKTVDNTGTKGAQLIQTAQKYMGVPYVWGGDTPDGWDCSGYTQYVMKENGITIPRTAAEQYNTGTPVNKSDLKIGDLVFFTTYKPGASHVGFYMGDGNFIHASSAAKQVTINSLSETYYDEHYIGARRYIQ
ncbi:C40 family peptidase [Sporomusa acidovorans]|uniref:NlpC/P60 domain-containing protein n=1 Tax=Sporomusa acidovorans (strain ATCC 49682 / DSM 3132 / Mol) TaxID=1123286 RepID=A0ABZ3JAV9_SPOA4|nr:C40 family peptidase [Sporomusa acidovorans]OZC21640.1 D-gamma-glutamyl-meso-diaminopimelic acid endopeptidase CwlS precursor [Sporomusa acidovorans DSM 3132]SDD61530.1 NlpC/P60 family protein [Sporomusa acidovorans]